MFLPWSAWKKHDIQTQIFLVEKKSYIIWLGIQFFKYHTFGNFFKFTNFCLCLLKKNIVFLLQCPWKSPDKKQFKNVQIFLLGSVLEKHTIFLLRNFKNILKPAVFGFSKNKYV